MRTLLVLVLFAHAAHAQCFTATDDSPGWKRVALDDRSQLAAPDDVEQFRTDSPALVAEENPPVFQGVSNAKLGPSTITFQPQPGTRSLTVEFMESLRGAKVDAEAHGPGRTITLLHEKRIGSDRLQLAWDADGIVVVTVRVHDHLRKTPSVRAWRVERRIQLAKEELGGIEPERALYFLQPPGARINLCEGVSRTYRVRSTSLAGRARTVALVPAKGGG